MPLQDCFVVDGLGIGFAQFELFTLNCCTEAFVQDRQEVAIPFDGEDFVSTVEQ